MLCAVASCAAPGEGVTQTRQQIQGDRDAGSGSRPGADAPDSASTTQPLTASLLHRAEGRPERVFALATHEELLEIAREAETQVAETRAAHASRQLEALRREPGGPDDNQQRALAAMAARSFEALTFAWDRSSRSPSWVRGVGVAIRGGDARQTWERYARVERDALVAVYGPDLLDQSVVLDVTRHMSEDVIALGRTVGGVPVEGDGLRIAVTRGESRVGAGVIRRMEGRWRQRSLAAPSTPREQWITASAACTRAGARDEPGRAKLLMRCDDACQPVWQVWGDRGRLTEVDALRGTILAIRDTRNNIGPLRQGTRLASSSWNVTTSRLRGASITDTAGNLTSWTDMSTGEHSESTSAQRFVNLAGPMTAGVWPPGRVDFRPQNSPATVWSYPTPWTPSSQPSRDFSNPDAWPSNTQSQQTASLLYGWLTYWQDLVRNPVGAPVVDTLSVEWDIPIIGPFGAGQSTTGDWSAPGSGQDTQGVIFAAANATDTVSAGEASGQFPVFAHEFGHTIIGCAAGTGKSCSDPDPHDSNTRPTQAADWRGAVHGAAVENFADAISGLLDRWRSPTAAAWAPGWNYTSYNDPNDSFGTLTQFPSTLVDCALAANPCPSGYSCMTNTIYPAVRPQMGQSIQTVGVCVKVVAQASDCPPYFSFAHTGGNNPAVLTPPPPQGSGYCMYNDYDNLLFVMIAARLDLSLGWLNTMRAMLWATEGNANNSVRDVVEGSDNWHDHLASALGNGRFEITRAVRSIYTGPNFVARDDHPDFFSHAIPIPVISSTPSRLWWGNGQYAYPRFEDLYDTDVFLFRGVSGSRYRVETWARAGSAAKPWVSLHRWDSSFTHVANSYPSGILADSGPVPADDWYIVAVWNGSTLGGDWEGNIRIVSGNDDFTDNAAEGYPLVRGISQAATHTSGDTADGYRIFLTTSMTDLQVEVSGAAGTTVQVLRPDGTLAVSATDIATLSSIDQNGSWRIKVLPPAAATSYSVVANHACPAASPNCDVIASPIPTQHAWGDLFGGRLPLAGSVARVRIPGLADDDEVSVSAVDTDPSCRLRIEVYGPDSLSYFSGPIMTWTDGAMFSDLPGYAPPGPGGHFSAIAGGDWFVRVSNDPANPGGAIPCPYYHVMVAKGHRLPSMPAW